tara:strand:+ start:1276 stop:1908 length:633 start_codon:yes stop_codon:yes gene_type:complete
MKINNKYSINYIDQINKGLNTSEFRINNNLIDMDAFFKNLITKTNEVSENKGRIFFFGNGASASFSNHMALDWSKNGGIVSFCLSDSSMLTALANDFTYETSFVEFMKINNPTINDLVVTTSSSGNSKNIVNILKFCKANNLTSVALSGLNTPNHSVNLCNFSIHVHMKTYGMVECIHQIFHHLWLDGYMGIEEWNKTESQNMDSKNFKL